MDAFDIRATLDTFSVIVDTREHVTGQSEARYKALSAPYRRQTLRFGDYAYDCVLPSGEPLYKPDETITPLAAVERKMSLDELAGCFTQGRARFKREFERARDAGSRLYLLVEGGSWEAIIAHRYRSRLHPNALMASLTAYMVRYNASVIFCKSDTSGRMIKEILYRDLKERLENGEIE